MKAQSSVEFLTIVGIALILAAPFVIQAQESMINVSLGSEAAEFQASLDRLDKSIRTIGTMGEPSKTTVTLTIPQDFVDAEVVEDRALLFVQENSRQDTNYTRVYDTTLYAEELPTERGDHDIRVEAWNDQVNLTPIDSAD